MAGPTRSCLACRRRDDKSSLIRFTVANGTIVTDPSATMPGRGTYLCHRSSCVDTAVDRGAARLLRALRAEGDRVAVDEQSIREQHAAAAEWRKAPGRASAGVSE